MKLNHLDLQVSDVPSTVALFERVFGLQCESNRNSPAIAFLSDGDGFVLVLQRKKQPAETYPDGFHFGFLVEDVATVERIHQAARDSELTVSELIRNNRGTMIYCRSPDGYLVEVNCRREG